MIVDNFNIISSLLKFENPGDFYFLQIIKRRKDNPEILNSESLIKNYCIYSLEELVFLKEEIIKYSIENNARAYIRLNRRNSNKIAFEMIKDVLNRIENNLSELAKHSWWKCCGQFNSEKNKSWIVDIDSIDLPNYKEIIKFIKKLYNTKETFDRKERVFIIKTVNGLHIVCPPFNHELFSKTYPNIDIHKDNPTLLYYSTK